MAELKILIIKKIKNKTINKANKILKLLNLIRFLTNYDLPLTKIKVFTKMNLLVSRRRF